MSKESIYVAGQRLYYQPHPERGKVRKGYPVVVTFVGRKWVYFKGLDLYAQEYRFGSSGAVDGQGYVSPGRIYLTEEDYQICRDTEAAWNKLKRRFSDYRVVIPIGVTVSSIYEAAALLGISMDDAQ